MEIDYTVPHRLSLDVPHLAEYFGIWSVHEPAFRSVVDRCNGLNLHAHIKSEEAVKAVSAQSSIEYQVTKDGIAIFQVNGPMMKYVSSLSGGTSTVRLRQQIRAARKDPEVAGAMLVMDTPGGTVKGNGDLASEVAAFAATKPIFAYIEDMTASAGVSVASQATKRFANNATALYGAMGTYAVILDQSGAAEKLGVKVHVVRAGEFKGMGEPGTEVTEQQLAELQRIINALNDQYLQLIASGLKLPMESIKAIADGRIHPAAEAQKMGLINGIQTYEATYRQLLESVSHPKSMRRQSAMEKTPATLAELKATFPNSTADWRESQLEAGASLSEAAISYAKFVETKAKEEKESLQKQLEEANSKKKVASGSLGHRPITADTDDHGYQSETGDPIEDFNAAVAQIAGKNADLRRRQNAVRTVAQRKPELYQAFLLATNPGKRQSRLISEKLESAVSKN